MANVLITGGAGYKGSSLTPRLVRDGHNVTLYDSILYDNRALSRVDRMLSEDLSVAQALIEPVNPFEGSKHFQFVQGDVRNRLGLAQVFKKKFDFVIHFAELVGNPACNRNAAATTLNNFLGTAYVTELAAKNEGSPIFLYPSSSSVYHSPPNPDVPVSEELKLPPIEKLDSYCQNKLFSENFIESMATANPLFRFVILRPATVGGISPRMRLDLLPNQLVYQAMVKGGMDMSTLNAHRAVIDILDIVDFYADVVNGNVPPNGKYNVGHHNETKLRFFQEARLAIGDRSFELRESQNQYGDNRNLGISSEKLSNVTGFSPTLSMQSTMRPLVEILDEDTNAFSWYGILPSINMTEAEWANITHFEPN